MVVGAVDLEGADEVAQGGADKLLVLGGLVEVGDIELEVVDLGHVEAEGLVVEVAVQLVGKVAHDTLKKRVDGAHVEVGVAMQNALQGAFCMVLYLLLAIAVGFDVVVEILSLAFRELVELGHDALLHLVGSLVGKGDGQHVLVIVAAAGAQLRAACLGVFRPQ